MTERTVGDMVVLFTASCGLACCLRPGCCPPPSLLALPLHSLSTAAKGRNLAAAWAFLHDWDPGEDEEGLQSHEGWNPAVSMGSTPALSGHLGQQFELELDQVLALTVACDTWASPFFQTPLSETESVPLPPHDLEKHVTASLWRSLDSKGTGFQS